MTPWSLQVAMGHIVVGTAMSITAADGEGLPAAILLLVMIQDDHELLIIRVQLLILLELGMRLNIPYAGIDILLPKLGRKNIRL